MTSKYSTEEDSPRKTSVAGKSNRVLGAVAKKSLFQSLIEMSDEDVVEYQPSGTGGTRSLPATPHRLQHLTARLIQNGRRSVTVLLPFYSLHFRIGTSVRCSNRSAFGRSTGNDVSGHYKRHSFFFFFLCRLLFS